jgi:beta-galactosidase
MWMSGAALQPLRLGGAPFAGVMAYTYREHLSDFVAAGIDMFRLSLPVGWVGPGRYDYTAGDEVVRAFCAAGPQVRLFPLLWVDGPETKWWELAYPQECAVMRARASGEVVRAQPQVPAYAAPGVDLEPGGDLFNRHHQGKPCLHSFASAPWRQDAQEALGRAIAHYEQAFPGRFAGYYVCAGLSYEWFGWGNYTDDALFDYSEPMRAYFRDWLRRRYATPAALAAAWRAPEVDFHRVEPPLPAQRPARHESPWLDPARHAPAADFAAALADAQADAFLALCREARSRAAPGRWIGGFYGYWWTQTDFPGPARSGHLALQRVLESPEVDFVGSPYDYSNRGVGGVNSAQTMPGSLRAHGKQYINSTDIKLATDTHDWHSFIRVPRTETEAVELMKRDFAFSLAEGQVQSWVDLFGGAFQRPVLREALARLQELARTHLELRRPPRSDALVVADEESLRWTTPNTPLTVPLFAVQKQWHLMRCGFPWTFITLEDFLQGSWPDARLVYFVNLFRHRRGLADSLHERLRALSATAVWTLWPGLLGDAGPDPAGAREFTGLEAAWRTPAGGDWRFRELPGGVMYGTDVVREECRARMKYYPPPEAFADAPRLEVRPETGDEVLAEWADGPAVACALTRRPGFASVFHAGPLMPPSLLGRLAAASGVHRYGETGQLVYANDRCVALYAGATGPRTIRFRTPVRVTDIWTGRVLTDQPVGHLTVETEESHTYLWRLDP